MKIRAKQFKCFEKLDYAFPTNNGFFLLVGANEENPQLGGNGCGKSTLFDALCWCLYGKTAKGAYAGELLQRQKTGGYEVEVDFGSFKVFRSWNPNKKQIDGREVHQEEIDLKIGLTYDQFLRAVYFAQGEDHFVDLSPGQKLGFLSQVFDLDRWTTCAELAKTKASTATGKIRVLQAKFDASAATLEQSLADLQTAESQKLSWDDKELSACLKLKEDLAASEKAKEQWQLEDENDIKELVQKKTELVADSEKWQTETETEQRGYQDKIKQLQSELGEVSQDSEVLEFEKTLKSLQTLQQEVNIAVGHLQRADMKAKVGVQSLTLSFNRILEETQQILDSTGKQCPTCKQEINEEHVKNICQEKLTRIEDAKQKVEAQQADANAIKEELAAFLTKQQLVDSEIETLKTKIITAKAERGREAAIYDQISELTKLLKKNYLNPYLAMISDIDKRLKSRPKNPFLVEIERLTHALNNRLVNPHIKQIEDLITRCRDLQAQTTVMQEEIKQLDDEVIIYGFWQKKFPEVRLKILEEVIIELELHFNQALSNLGLMNWSVSLKTERELKSEAIKKELSLKLFNGKQEISLTGLSGGERQRIRIASAVGIGDLVKARLGVKWPIQLWDEPSLGLSQEGVSDMLEFFSALAETHQIFLAEHRVEESSRFDAIIEVRKNTQEVSTISVLNEARQHNLDSHLVPSGMSGSAS